MQMSLPPPTQRLRRALRVTGVALAVADELVGAVAEVGGERDRQPVQDPDEIAGGAHPDDDRADVADGREDGRPVAGRVAAAGSVRAVGPFDHSGFPLTWSFQFEPMRRPWTTICPSGVALPAPSASIKATAMATSKATMRGRFLTPVSSSENYGEAN